MRVVLSPATKKCASSRVVSGMIAIRMPASALSSDFWPHEMNQNGMQLPTTASTTYGSHARPSGGNV